MSSPVMWRAWSPTRCRSRRSRACNSPRYAAAAGWSWSTRRAGCAIWSTSWACGTRSVQPRRQSEEREDRLRRQEERELDDLAVLDLEHLQRPRVVAGPGLARLVLTERRRAVGGDGREDLRAATGDAPAHPPAEDLVAAAQPQLVRRHGLRRVLVDQRGQRLHVVALERLDVAGGQLAGRRLDGPRR